MDEVDLLRSSLEPPEPVIIVVVGWCFKLEVDDVGLLRKRLGFEPSARLGTVREGAGENGNKTMMNDVQLVSPLHTTHLCCLK